MKHLLSNSTHYSIKALTLVLISFMCSCSNYVNDLSPNTSTIATAEIKSLDGILIFKDHKSFESFSQTIGSIDSASSVNFEKNHNFISKFTYERENANAEKGMGFHSLNTNTGFINNFARTINSNGYVIIGRALYYYSEDYVKNILLDRLTKESIQRGVVLLRSATSSDSQKKIFVSKVEKSKATSRTSSQARVGYTPYLVSIQPNPGANGYDGHLYQTKVEAFWNKYQYTVYVYDESQCDPQASYYDEYGNFQCVHPISSTYQANGATLGFYITGLRDGQIAPNGKAVYYNEYITYYKNGAPIFYVPISVNNNNSGGTYGVGGYNWYDISLTDQLEFEGYSLISVYYENSANFYDPRYFYY